MIMKFLDAVTPEGLTLGAIVGGVIATLVYDIFFKRLALAMGTFLAGFLWRFTMMLVGLAGILGGIYSLGHCDLSHPRDQLRIALHAIPILLGIILIWGARTRTKEQFKAEMAQIQKRTERMENLSNELSSISAEVHQISEYLKADGRIPDLLKDG